MAGSKFFGKWNVESGKWNFLVSWVLESDFWKVECDFWKVRTFSDIRLWDEIKKVKFPIMIISQSDVLVRLHEILDDSVDSSRQKLSQDQRKRLQQLLWSCCYQFQKFKNTLKISLEKKNTKFWRNPIGWLAQTFSGSGMWQVESGKWNFSIRKVKNKFPQGLFFNCFVFVSVSVINSKFICVVFWSTFIE